LFATLVIVGIIQKNKKKQKERQVNLRYAARVSLLAALPMQLAPIAYYALAHQRH